MQHTELKKNPNKTKQCNHSSLPLGICTAYMIIFTLSEDVAKFGTKSKRSLPIQNTHVLLFSANKQIQPIEKINLVYKSEKDSVIYFNYNIDCTVSAVIYYTLTYYDLRWRSWILSYAYHDAKVSVFLPSP